MRPTWPPTKKFAPLASRPNNSDSKASKPFVVGCDNPGFIEDIGHIDPFSKQRQQEKQYQQRQQIPGETNEKEKHYLPTQVSSDKQQVWPPSFEIVWRDLRFEVEENTGISGGLWQIKDKILETICCSSAKNSLALSHKSTDNNSISLSQKVIGDNNLSKHHLADYCIKDIVKENTFRTGHGSLKTGGAKKKRMIFKNLNGSIRSGEISGILGPSGAGKTSLLNALTGKTDGYQGQVNIIGGQDRRMRMSIIPQKDYLVETLTVRENLVFASKIKNYQPGFDHEANIEKVIDMLNLRTCISAMAGNISGGEHKRVSIAQELLSNPDLLVLDEPTSGLDSLNCKKLLLTLQGLTQSSRLGLINPIAIVMTIHQPEVDVYHMFDHVYFMARQGRVIFDGRPGDALNTVKQFSGISYAITNSVYSPANYLIEIASEEYGQEPIDQLSLHQRRQFYESKCEFAAAGKQHQDNQCGSTGKTSRESTNKCDYMVEKSVSDGQAEVKAGVEFIVLPVADLNNSDTTKDYHHHLGLPHASAAAFTISSSTTISSSSKDEKSIQSTTSTSFNRDKRLYAKTNHDGHFWRHVKLLTKRAFISTLRDPLLTTSTAIFHLFIPFVMYTVYATKTGQVNSCPIIQREMDTMTLISNQTADRLHMLQEDFIISLEASTMFFLITYAFSMCTLCVAALTFPLTMHITLKEYRNGWYSMASYVLAKTLANIPFETIFPMVSLCIAYPLLGHPHSYLEWRMLSIALVMAAISMIANAQGLIFGALFMDSVQSATFMANASTLPLVLMSGFTAKIQHMPVILQYLSWGSVYKYASDSISIIRFGFGQCPCDEELDRYIREVPPRLKGIPNQMKSMFNFYLVNGMADVPNTSTLEDNDYEANSETTTMNPTPLGIANNVTRLISHLAPSTTTMAPSAAVDKSWSPSSFDLARSSLRPDQLIAVNSTANDLLIKRIENGEVDVFQELANLFAKSFAFGEDIKSCDDVRSQVLKSGIPPDSYLPYIFGCMLAMMLALRLVLFFVIKAKIESRL